MSEDDPKRIVERGYDAIADRFATWQAQISDERRLRYLADLLELLPERPDVLELGVGAGVESSRILAARGQLDRDRPLARAAAPRARSLAGGDADPRRFHRVELPAAGFDAVVSFYVLNNLPQPELAPLFRRIAAWLRPGGWLLASLPRSDNPGWRGDWLGGRDVLRGLRLDDEPGVCRAGGLEVVRDELETMVEPEGEVRWQWLLAQRL